MKAFLLQYLTEEVISTAADYGKVLGGIAITIAMRALRNWLDSKQTQPEVKS